MNGSHPVGRSWHAAFACIFPSTGGRPGFVSNDLGCILLDANAYLHLSGDFYLEKLALVGDDLGRFGTTKDPLPWFCSVCFWLWLCSGSIEARHSRFFGAYFWTTASCLLSKCFLVAAADGACSPFFWPQSLTLATWPTWLRKGMDCRELLDSAHDAYLILQPMQHRRKKGMNPWKFVVSWPLDPELFQMRLDLGAPFVQRDCPSNAFAHDADPDSRPDTSTGAQLLGHCGIHSECWD